MSDKKTMLTKSELIKIVADESGLSQVQVKQVLGVFQKTLLTSLKSDKEVTVLDLGKLKIARRNERQGVNPQKPDGPKILIPAKDVPQLKPSKKLKDYVAGDSDIDNFSY